MLVHTHKPYISKCINVEFMLSAMFIELNNPIFGTCPLYFGKCAANSPYCAIRWHKCMCLSLSLCVFNLFVILMIVRMQTHTHTIRMKWQQKYDIANLIATVWNSIIYSKYRHNKHMKTLRFVGSVISVTALSVLFHNKQYALIAFWLAQNVKRSHRKYDDFRSCSICFGFCTHCKCNQ